MIDAGVKVCPCCHGVLPDVKSRGRLRVAIYDDGPTVVSFDGWRLTRLTQHQKALLVAFMDAGRASTARLLRCSVKEVKPGSKTVAVQINNMRHAFAHAGVPIIFIAVDGWGYIMREIEERLGDNFIPRRIRGERARELTELYKARGSR